MSIFDLAVKLPAIFLIAVVCVLAFCLGMREITWIFDRNVLPPLRFSLQTQCRLLFTACVAFATIRWLGLGVTDYLDAVFVVATLVGTFGGMYLGRLFLVSVLEDFGVAQGERRRSRNAVLSQEVGSSAGCRSS